VWDLRENEQVGIVELPFDGDPSRKLGTTPNIPLLYWVPTLPEIDDLQGVSVNNAEGLASYQKMLVQQQIDYVRLPAGYLITPTRIAQAALSAVRQFCMKKKKRDFEDVLRVSRNAVVAH
jgi:hypothetical protein